LVLAAYLVAYLAVMALYFVIYLQTDIWQMVALLSLMVVLVTVTIIALWLYRMGRGNQGVLLNMGTMMAIFPSVPLLVAGGMGYILGAVTAILCLFLSGPFSTPKQRGWIITGGLVSGVISYLFEFFGSSNRPTIPLIQTGMPVIVLAGIVVFSIIIGRMLWNTNRLRNRIFVLIVAFLLPIAAISSWYNIQAQRKYLEAALTAKAENAAISGAATVGKLFEYAIARGELTEEEAFDTNYVRFWEFDPNTYEFDGAPSSLDKYHTSYDAYTDKNWQGLLDSFLNQADFVFTIPVDRNGYLPTHNTRWSSWDGSPATDRSKRIFNDPIGIKAAQNTQPILKQTYQRPGTNEILLDVSAPIYVNGKHWGAFRVGTLLFENDLFANSAIQASTQRSLFSLFFIILGIVISAQYLGTYISGPLETLTETAKKVAEGQLDHSVDIPSRAEVTVLADAFHTMTVQLKELIGSLEQRVSDRTKALTASAEVSRRLSSILDQHQLVNEVVEQLRSAFNYYHAHIYLFDEAGESLVMTGGTGEIGKILLERDHKIQRGRGLVGRAAETKSVVLVPDTSQDPHWLPNSLLPETKSEIAVPITAGEQVLGVLDVQHNIKDGLSEEDAKVLQSIALQTAIALRNIQSFSETRKRAEHETLVSSIGQKIQGSTSVEEVLQVAARELGLALGSKQTRIILKNPGFVEVDEN
jgi:putative methionine-R-sulfoxide reductase with GAF domain